jgi:hypothetical protein
MTIDNEDTGKQKAAELAEKDERHVWHAMSHLNPSSKQISPPMMVAEGDEPRISDTARATATSTA